MLIIPSDSIKSEIYVPGDKSISHRAIMLSSVAEDILQIDNFLFSKDCLNTINCFKKLGINIDIINNKVKIKGKGLKGLKAPKKILNVGNSGTTARLIMGILSGQNFASTIDGDNSVRRRPMKRVTNPLSLMGANFDSYNHLPISITGNILKGIKYTSSIASAQIKSSIIFASLFANSKTIYTEPNTSRNHTELILKHFGANIKTNNNTITSYPVPKLQSQYIKIPGDISSAAFFITLALISNNSQITIKNVGINPTRTGILDIYKKMGAIIKVENTRYYGYEPVADITAFSSFLKGITINEDIIPTLIDEITIIAVAATQANGTTIIKGAQELKIKESNRIKTIVTELSKMGADIKETSDGMIIKGYIPLKGATVESYNDHRIAMSLAIASKIAHGQTKINNSDCVDISFPGFFELLNKVCE